MRKSFTRARIFKRIFGNFEFGNRSQSIIVNVIDRMEKTEYRTPLPCYHWTRTETSSFPQYKCSRFEVPE